MKHVARSNAGKAPRRRRLRLDRSSFRGRGRRMAAGFTLIELMIAITILAVIAILAWRGLDQIVRGREVVSNVMADERVVAQALDQIGTDARAAANDDDIGSGAGSIGGAVRIGGGLVQIVRWLDVPGHAPRLQVVRYSVVSRQLIRAASLPLATMGELRRALNADGDGQNGWSRVALIRGAAGIQSRAWIDGKGWTANNGDVDAAARGMIDRLGNPLYIGAPLPRAVTGVEVQIAVGSNNLRYLRMYPVGQ